MRPKASSSTSPSESPDVYTRSSASRAGRKRGSVSTSHTGIPTTDAPQCSMNASSPASMMCRGPRRTTTRARSVDTATPTPDRSVPVAVPDRSGREKSGRQMSAPRPHDSYTVTAAAPRERFGDVNGEDTSGVIPTTLQRSPARRSTVLELVEGPGGFYSIEVSVAPPHRKPRLRLIPGGRTD